jgi:hypothetical protein
MYESARCRAAPERRRSTAPTVPRARRQVQQMFAGIELPQR